MNTINLTKSAIINAAIKCGEAVYVRIPTMRVDARVLSARTRGRLRRFVLRGATSILAARFPILPDPRAGGSQQGNAFGDCLVYGAFVSKSTGVIL